MTIDVNSAVVDLEEVGFSILRKVKQEKPVEHIIVHLTRTQIPKIFGEKVASRYPTTVEFKRSDGTMGRLDLRLRKEVWKVSVSGRTS